MVKGSLLRRLTLLTTVSLGSAMVLLPVAALDNVPLKLAVIASLRNAVELSLPNQAPRSANVRDTLSPGEALSTAQAARVELRFNDGSLARVGGQAFFRFVAETRTLQLSNGTLLVLVPPNRGQTRIQTPNAVVNIRGSALFVRYLPAADTTLVGALTESGIEITNRDRSQMQKLQAGQIAVVANNRIAQVYHFDLKTFYDTSELVKDLNLQCAASGDRAETDPALAAVRSETAEAANIQTLSDSCSEKITADGQPRATTKAPVVSQPTLSPTAVEPQTEESSAIATPANRLLVPPTVTMPATFPPTLALPTTTPLVNPPAAIEVTSPRLGEPPSLKGSPSSVVGMPSSQGNVSPAFAGTPSSDVGIPPGQTP